VSTSDRTTMPGGRIRVSFEEMRATFERILRQAGFEPERAALCARLFAENTLDGVASHGVNSFPGFIDRIRQGYVRVDAEPELVASHGAWEQWDGNLGPGPLNAYACTERALELAREHGIGCVGLSNTNHWMRAGAYGWHAAQTGFAFMCWTNTTTNMPPWGGLDKRVGNNPLVLAVPRSNGAVVLDMAMSQFSLGRLAIAEGEGQPLPVPGGFDAEGNLTHDPGAIRASGRVLPMGFWKGSGLALLLDLLATLMSGGKATYQIAQQETEYGVSQVYIAFDVGRSTAGPELDRLVDQVIEHLHGAMPVAEGVEVRYPGERALRTRQENLAQGIPVDPSLWQAILALQV
jgi:3-dehydro-L-gulonate 2-dehydrogenase